MQQFTLPLIVEPEKPRPLSVDIRTPRFGRCIPGMSDDGFRKLGALIRTCRSAARLTQAELGRRAGIVGKYVSEIERGTRDIPFSTLRAIAEDGLGLVLDVRFRATAGATAMQDEIPAAIA